MNPVDPTRNELPRRRASFFHPASGALILALDWVLFSGNLFSAGVATLPLAAVGFGLTFTLCFWIQRRFASDACRPALLKASLAGFAVGIPTPIFGTILGAAIFSAAGMGSRSRTKS